MNKYWKNRGEPWEHDPGPPKNLNWASLFAHTPNYRKLGKAATGKEKFRWHFGPMFYRGRLTPNSVKVLVIGQEGAQDESLAHRSFTGGTGARMQHFLKFLGITESYLFMNTFVYPIHGQYDENSIKTLAQSPASQIAQHRHDIFNYVLAQNDLQLIIAVGTAAKESVVSWVQSKGGNCPSGDNDVSICTGSVLGPSVKIVGVMHPGGAANGGSTAAIKASFVNAIQQIKGWLAADPTWLPVDTEATRNLNKNYTYSSAPIPFRDLPFGTNWRLGRGATSSNRKDSQRSIQLFSAGGAYNAVGDSISYSGLSQGSATGYDSQFGDVPYEPPNILFHDYDTGPSAAISKLIMGGQSGLEWPDFNALGVNVDPSFGYGPIYRGRFDQVKVLIFADQQSHDDLFTGRALTGDSGQHIQSYLESIGITSSYLILRVLPVDTLDLSSAAVNAILGDTQVKAVYQAIFNKVLTQNPGVKLLLTFGQFSANLVGQLNVGTLNPVSLKSWKASGALADWQSKLPQIQAVAYSKDIASPTFSYNGERKMIPRLDLPYGTLCWQGSSGDRAQRAKISGTSQWSNDYYKIFLPDWVYDLPPAP